MRLITEAIFANVCFRSQQKLFKNFPASHRSGLTTFIISLLQKPMRTFRVKVETSSSHSCCPKNKGKCSCCFLFLQVGGSNVYKPLEANYSKFWIDFNDSSRSVIFLCQFDSDATDVWNSLTFEVNF